jgi:5-formyltetrahydrofolate cyclo-ligase
MTKGQLRTRMMRQLRQQKEAPRRRKSEAIWRKLRRLTAFRRAKLVCCYVALPYEVQTWGLIEQMLERGKRVVVPVVRRSSRRLWLSEIRDPAADLAPGAFGVPEPRRWRGARRPVPAREVDLAIVPGLAFDRRGHRLGHGLGFFDRFLARLPESVPTVGLAYRFQLLPTLPTSLHDRAVRTVLSA